MGRTDNYYVTVTSGGIAEVTVPFAAGHEFLMPEVTVTADSNGFVELACYVAGTKIATPQGEETVECLRIGSNVLTASGESRCVHWVGVRSYASRFLAATPACSPSVSALAPLATGCPAAIYSFHLSMRCSWTAC